MESGYLIEKFISGSAKHKYWKMPKNVLED